MKYFLVLILLFLSISVSSKRVKVPRRKDVSSFMKTEGTFKSYSIEFEQPKNFLHNNLNVRTNMFITMDPRFALREYEVGENMVKEKTERSETTPSCCTFIGGGAKWEDLATFKMDTTNPNGLTSQQLQSWQNSAFNQWNDALTDLNILAPVVIEDLPSFLDPNTPDGINTITFGLIVSGVIAVTSTHYVQSGGSITIFESDIVYNTNVPLGQGSNVYDFWSVATHETGHAIGLGHPPQTLECIDSSMYPTVGLGQTNKRDITGTDAQCLQVLYTGANISNGGERKTAGVLFLSVLLGLFFI